MGPSEKLEIEETMIVDGVKGRSKDSGYFVTKRTLLLCLIIVVLLCLTIGLAAAYLGPGRKDEKGELY